MKRMGDLFLLGVVTVFVMVSCGGGGGGGGGSTTTAPATNPEAVTAIAAQTGSPVISGFDLQFKQGDWWLYDYKDVFASHTPSILPGGVWSTTTTTLTGTARITLGSPKTILGIPFFQVITQYTGDVDTSYFINWQYVASFDNKIYGCKDDQIFLIFDAHNGSWVGGGFFGGITYDEYHARTYILSAYKDMFGVVTPGKYYVEYPKPNSFSLNYKEDYFTQGVGPSGYYVHYMSGSVGNGFDWIHAFTLVGSGDVPPPPPPTNSAPIARIIANATFNTGTPITLDATSSTDANNDPLTFTWSITSKPTGATASLSDVHAPKPTLTADLAGAYQITLVVNDVYRTSSAPISTSVTAVSSENRLKVELLKGYWTLNYTISTSNFTNNYTLDNIVESTVTSGDYFINGTGNYWRIITAKYISTSSSWNILDQGDFIDMYYLFKTDGSSILPGSCYYQIRHPSEEWSSCYSLSGFKYPIPTTLSPSLVSKHALERNIRDEVLEYSAPPPEVLQQYINLKQQYDGK